MHKIVHLHNGNNAQMTILSFSYERFIVPRLCMREINVSDYSNKLRTSFFSLHEYISKSMFDSW